jgi:hypothetical protein
VTGCGLDDEARFSAADGVIFSPQLHADRLCISQILIIGKDWRPESEEDQSRESTAELKNELSFNSTHPMLLCGIGQTLLLPS